MTVNSMTGKHLFIDTIVKAGYIESDLYAYKLVVTPARLIIKRIEVSKKSAPMTEWVAIWEKNRANCFA